MNRKFTYLLLIGLFLAGIAFIILKSESERRKGKNAYYELLERKGPLASTPEWTNTRAKVQSLYRKVQESPTDTKSALGLATIYLKEARITGNYSYYDMAAMRQVNNILELDSNNFEALTYKSLIYLSQHHFTDGFEMATRAQRINPYNSFIYGILVDANVELGNYPAAVNNAEKMVSIRPDLRSYSRISYLREIHGDYPGAIEAMKLAVAAGVDGDEGTEWTRVQLGHLYENCGSLDSAEFEYAQALEFRKGFAPAISGLGHIALVRNDYPRAMSYFEQSDSLVMDYTIKENLAEIYRIGGRTRQADSVSLLVVDKMSEDAGSANANSNIGHYVDKELAYAYLNIGENQKALQHALAEYNRRPDNIDANETLAWAYYKNSDFQKAITYLAVALRTNCKAPTLLCHAGLIYTKGADRMKAKQLLTEGLRNNPGIDVELRTESEKALRSL